MKRHKIATKKIKTALHEEKEAIHDYKEDAKKVDTKTAKLFRHISRDEQHHHKELTKRLKKIKKLLWVKTTFCVDSQFFKDQFHVLFMKLLKD